MQAVPEPDPRRALRDRGQQRDRLVAGLREQAVADPDRVEPDASSTSLTGRAASAGRSPAAISGSRLLRLTPNSSRRSRLRTTSRQLLVGHSSRRCCGTRMCAAMSCAARSASRAAERVAGSPRARRPSDAGCREGRASGGGSGPSGRAAGRTSPGARGCPDASTRSAWNSAFASKKASTSLALGVLRHRAISCSSRASPSSVPAAAPRAGPRWPRAPRAPGRPRGTRPRRARGRPPRAAAAPSRAPRRRAGRSPRERAAAHAELRRRAALPSSVPGRQAVGEDLLAQVGVHALPERQVLETASGELGFRFVVEEGLQPLQSDRRARLTVARSSVTVGKSDPIRGMQRSSNTGGGTLRRPDTRDRRRGQESTRCTCVEHGARVVSPPWRLSRSRSRRSGLCGDLGARGRERQGRRHRHARQDQRLRLEPAGRQQRAGCGSRRRREGRTRSRTSATTRPTCVLRQLAKSGANFIIAARERLRHHRARIAQQYKVPIDHLRRPDDAGEGRRRRTSTTSSQQGAYLAGHPGREDDQDAQGRHRHLRRRSRTGTR